MQDNYNDVAKDRADKIEHEARENCSPAGVYSKPFNKDESISPEDIARGYLLLSFGQGGRMYKVMICQNCGTFKADEHIKGCTEEAGHKFLQEQDDD